MATLTQLHQRARHDDGSETSATWIAAEDTDFTLAKGSNKPFRLRSLVDVNGVSVPITSFVLRYAKNGGSFADVGDATSGIILAATSQGYADHSATTAQLTPPVNGDTFVAGTMQTADATTGALNVNSKYTEYEHMLKMVDADVVEGDYFDFRIYVTGPTALDSYTEPVRLTVAAQPLDIATDDLLILGVT